MSFIGEPLREWDVQEPSIIPEREVEEVERESEVEIETSPEKEEVKTYGNA